MGNYQGSPGIRVRMKGLRDVNEFKTVLIETFDKIVQQTDMLCVSSANLYFHAKNKDREKITEIEIDGERFSGVEVPEPDYFKKIVELALEIEEDETQNKETPKLTLVKDSS